MCFHFLQSVGDYPPDENMKNYDLEFYFYSLVLLSEFLINLFSFIYSTI